MTRILMADDQSVFRRGLKDVLLDRWEGPIVFGEASSGQEVLDQCQEEKWDLLLLDLNLPDMNGLELLKRLSTLYPELPILVVSLHAENQYGFRAIRAGARGCLTKEAPPEEMQAALQKVLSGGKYISPTLAERIAGVLGRDDQRLPHERLSDREFQVLCLMGSGNRVIDIARNLNLSVKTISTHRRKILDKMKLRTTAELMHYAIENRLPM